MQRASIQSSAILSIGYDERERTLEIEFVNGRIYRYFDVPSETLQSFLRAESKGKYMNAHIRLSFPYRRLR